MFKHDCANVIAESTLNLELIFFIFFFQDDNHRRPAGKKCNDHLNAFLDAVHSLGISFKVYKVNDKLEGTSLIGWGEKGPTEKTA